MQYVMVSLLYGLSSARPIFFLPWVPRADLVPSWFVYYLCILPRCESRTYNKGVTTLHVIDKHALYRYLLYSLFEVACIV